MSDAVEDPDAPIEREELSELFRRAEKPAAAFRVGGEAEKFGVDRTTGAPICYEGPRGIRRIFEVLVRDHGWTESRETPDGPVIALTRGAANITLEPAAQLELSGAPADSVHTVCVEMREHLSEIAAISQQLNVAWLGVGFHPLARQEDLPWVPKQRYSVMRDYLPKQGARALDMMRRTATVQANFDYCSEQDAMTKLVLLLRLSPIINAMTANSPFCEGKVSKYKSERGHVWLHMDPARSGLIRGLWDEPEPTYESYVEWALDAGMFLIRRGDRFIANTGQTFRSFLADGFEGHRARWADWVSHINSLFPEARLKRTIEARSCDALPGALVGAVPALFTGLLYEARALGEATELASTLSYDAVSEARLGMLEHGLGATVGGRPVQRVAERILEIADGGLERRARFDAHGKDERVHLGELRSLIARGMTPADALLQGLSPSEPLDAPTLIARTEI